MKHKNIKQARASYTLFEAIILMMKF